MYSLNQRINQSNVTVNSLHPGVVHSEFTRSFEDDCTWTCTYNCAKCFGNIISFLVNWLWAEIYANHILFIYYFCLNQPIFSSQGSLILSSLWRAERTRKPWMTSEDGVYQNICHLYKTNVLKSYKMTGHPCHQLMHIYNLNVGKDGMDGDWKTLGKK